MSFILDALKKLEREKATRDPNVVMVGPVPWGGSDRSHFRRKLGLALVGLGVVVAGVSWWLASGPEPAPSTATAVPEPTAAAAVVRPETAIQSSSPEPPALPAARPADAPAPRSVALPGAPAAAPPVSEPDPPEASPSEAVPQTVSDLPGVPAPVDEALVAEDPLPSPVDETTSPDATELRLSAISSRDGQPVALLNDRLVREGDAFGKIRILRIGTTEVEIEVDGERRTIGF